MGARVDEEVTVAMLVAMGMPERVAEWTCEFFRERTAGRATTTMRTA